MKLSAVKFIHTVYFDGQDRLFLDVTKDKALSKVELFLDTKTNLVKLTSERDVVYAPILNVCWLRPAKVEEKNG